MSTDTIRRKRLKGNMVLEKEITYLFKNVVYYLWIHNIDNVDIT